MRRKRYRINDLVTSLDDERSPRELLARTLSVPQEELGRVRVIRRSLDARRKPRLRVVWSLVFELDPGQLPAGSRGSGEYSAPEKPRLPELPAPRERPVGVGAGPAGLFAALGLVVQGYRPLVLERGARIAERNADVLRSWKTGTLDPESNVQFGEGGAGTFSDGKLTSRSVNWFTRFVHRYLVHCGALEEVTYSHLPHVGTNGVRRLTTRMRRELRGAGAEFRFLTRVEDFEFDAQGLAALRLAGGERLPADVAVLALGHSARDTLSTLLRRGVEIGTKPFAMGLRIEHPREFIDVSQYGVSCATAGTGAASYRLSTGTEGSGGVYSFCMCPGGMVIMAASEPGRLCVNGMSFSSRRMRWSNAALVVGLSAREIERLAAETVPADPGPPGVAIQRWIESLAFRAGGGSYAAPAQRAEDFMSGKRGGDLPRSSYLPHLNHTALKEYLPAWLTEPLKQALRIFDRRIPGFVGEGLLISPESRTSSPVRILRDPEFRRSLSHPGLYPVGEGAGYAGGIVSSAADGLRTGLSFASRGKSTLDWLLELDLF